MSLQQVAQDAVRSAYGDVLADALDVAAAAILHLDAIRAALRPDPVLGCRGLVTLVPGDTPSAPGEPRCGARAGASHYSTCPYAAALRALDPRWAAEELQAAWNSALRHARFAGLLGQLRQQQQAEPAPVGDDAVDADAEQIALANSDPDELRMLLNHAASAVGGVLRIRLPDGRLFVGRPATRLRGDTRLAHEPTPGNPA